MRRPVAILLLALASILVIDIAAPAFIRLEPGSVGIEPQAADLELLPFHPGWDDPEGAQPDWTDDESCMRRYGLSRRSDAHRVVLGAECRPAAHHSPRRVGRVDRAVHGIVPLARPTTGLDGGDPHVA